MTLRRAGKRSREQVCKHRHRVTISRDLCTETPTEQHIPQERENNLKTSRSRSRSSEERRQAAKRKELTPNIWFILL
jgi:hypothetical protein